VSTIIAERIVQIGDRAPRENGFVRVYSPVSQGQGREWSCDVHLSWSGEEVRHSIFGIDSYQALILAMRHAVTLIQISDAFKTNRLYEFDNEHPLSDLEFSFGFRPL
jgi:hypothetical protein